MRSLRSAEVGDFVIVEAAEKATQRLRVKRLNCLFSAYLGQVYGSGSWRSSDESRVLATRHL